MDDTNGEKDPSLELRTSQLVLIIFGTSFYFVGFVSYLYMWKLRYFPPLRVKNPGLTLLSNIGAWIWFVDVLFLHQLNPLWTSGRLSCWFASVFFKYFGRTLFVAALVIKQYRAFRTYGQGIDVYPPSKQLGLCFLPFLVLLISPDTLHTGQLHGCCYPSYGEHVSWAYQVVAAMFCLLFVANLRQTVTRYTFPNFAEACLECAGLLLQTILLGVSMYLHIDPTNTLGLAGDVVCTAVIPISLFLGVMGRPMWKFGRGNDRTYTADFDQRYGAAATHAATAIPGMAYLIDGHHQQQRSNPTSINFHHREGEMLPPPISSPIVGGHSPVASFSFEVELLSRLVRGGELSGVMHHLYHSNLASINEKDSEGSSPLHWAVRAAQPDMVRMLLTMAADPNIVDSDNLSPLHIAASLDNSALITILAQHGADVNIFTKAQGKSPLHICVKLNFLKSLLALIEFKANCSLSALPPLQSPQVDLRTCLRKAGGFSPYKSPLFMACELGHTDALPLLKNARYDLLGPNGTPLVGAAAMMTQPGVLRFLMAAKADVLNHSREHKRNLLHYAAMSGNGSIMQLAGISVLQAAAKFPEEGSSFVSVSMVDESCSSSESADESCHDSLRFRRRDLNRPGEAPLRFFEFLDMSDFLGRTPLHYAVLKGSIEAVTMLLDWGASPTIKDSKASRFLRRNASTGDGLDYPGMGWTPQRYCGELAKTSSQHTRLRAALEKAQASESASQWFAPMLPNSERLRRASN